MRFVLQILLVFAVLAGIGPELRADLEAVKREAKWEKRARKAMDNAKRALEQSREAYRSGRIEESEAALKEVADSVILAQESLQASGRPARKVSRHYKRAEIGSRKLLRELDGFRNEMSYLEREQIDKVIQTVQRVQDELLHAVMGGSS